MDRNSFFRRIKSNEVIKAHLFILCDTIGCHYKRGELIKNFELTLRSRDLIKCLFFIQMIETWY